VKFWGSSKTCSPKCGHKIQGLSISGEKNPFLKRHPAKRKACACCGKLFWLSKGNGAGIYFCSNACYFKKRRISQRQLAIEKRLLNLGHEVLMEKSWPWLKSPFSKQRLRVDLFLPKINLAIEYHGRQHFQKCAGGIDKLTRTKALDAEKQRLLSAHKIPLLVLFGWPILPESLENVIPKYERINSSPKELTTVSEICASGS
jgi:hypothetical protein